MIWTGLVMGVLGTLAMDLWALFLTLFGQARPDWAMPGRWLGHVARGRVFHEDIGAAEPVAGERALGVLYGVAFVLLAGRGWLAEPTFLPLWGFSLLTIAAGWFLLLPGMGLGWAGSRMEAPWKARAMGLVAHTVFAVGMWVPVGLR